MENWLLAQEILQQVGFETKVAVNGEEGVDLFRVWHPDLMLMDVRMPHVDGYAAYEVLRDALDPQVPIIACTVHNNEIGHVRDLGFNGFISKPLDPARFADQFDSILNGQPVWEY